MLDGVISEDVMLSIFDPTSPGHDGAMILNKNRIEKFGVHLPLSNNFREIGKHGTRHSAALGIAERSDALALVVSEESGMMSLAQNGSLKEVKSLEELELRLNKFLREKLPDDYANSFTDIIRYNMREKIAALAIAILLKLLSIG